MSQQPQDPKTYLKYLGFSDEEITAIPPGQLEAWGNVINQKPLDQKFVRDFVLQRMFYAIGELVKPPVAFWQAFLRAFGRDPAHSFQLAHLGLLADLYKLMNYDPQEAYAALEAELKKRAGAR